MVQEAPRVVQRPVMHALKVVQKQEEGEAEEARCCPKAEKRVPNSRAHQLQQRRGCHVFLPTKGNRQSMLCHRRQGISLKQGDFRQLSKVPIPRLTNQRELVPIISIYRGIEGEVPT